MQNGNSTEMLIRGSEAQDFLRCRLRWYYNWFLGLKPKSTNDKLFFGNLFHKFAEVLYTVDDHHAQKAMYRMYQTTPTEGMPQTVLDDLWDTADKVTANYVEMWKNQDQRLNTIATELQFAVPLKDDIWYTGTIDWVYTDELGNLWAADHKTSADVAKYEKGAIMDRQISRYFWAMNMLCNGVGYVYVTDIADPDTGEKLSDQWTPVTELPRLWQHLQGKQLHSYMYNIIARAVPEQPKMVKASKKKDDTTLRLSTDKSQKTTYDMYAKKCVEEGILQKVSANFPTGDKWTVFRINNVGYGLADNDYKGVLEALLANESEFGNKFFRRVPVQRNIAEQQAAIIEFYKTAFEASNVQKRLAMERAELVNRCDNEVGNGLPLADDLTMLDNMNIYRNINHDCSWDCSYRSLCIAAMDGSDPNTIVNLGFTKEVK